jgi:hypothetical protein
MEKISLPQSFVDVTGARMVPLHLLPYSDERDAKKHAFMTKEAIARAIEVEADPADEGNFNVNNGFLAAVLGGKVYLALANDENRKALTDLGFKGSGAVSVPFSSGQKTIDRPVVWAGIQAGLWGDSYDRLVE